MMKRPMPESCSAPSPKSAGRSSSALRRNWTSIFIIVLQCPRINLGEDPVARRRDRCLDRAGRRRGFAVASGSGGGGGGAGPRRPFTGASLSSGVYAVACGRGLRDRLFARDGGGICDGQVGSCRPDRRPVARYLV